MKSEFAGYGEVLSDENHEGKCVGESNSQSTVLRSLAVT